MTNLLLKITLLVWPFGQLLSVALGSGYRVHILDVLAILLGLVMLFEYKSKDYFSRAPFLKPLLIFIVIAAISLLFALFNSQPDSITPALLYLARFVTYTFFLFAFIIADQKNLRPYLFLSALLFVGLGLVQYFFLPDVRYLKYLGFDDHYYRLIGTFLDPNFTGAVLAVFGLFSLTNLKGRSRALLLPVLLALALTFSRASYVAFAVGLVYLVILRKNYTLLLFLAILSLFIYFIPKPFGEGVNLFRTFSVISRGQNLANSFTLFTKHPLFGVGFNTLKQADNSLVPNLTSGVDNSFLFVAVTTGIFGFAAFMKFLIASFMNQSDSAPKAAIVIILTHSLFNNTFFYSWILVLFFFLIGTRPNRST